MGSDHRPHLRTTSTGHSNTPTTTNELFICFASRLTSSSSMKLTKSILSPGRAARDGAAAAGPVSLSSSLSRRLRSNGSLKGGASPFITTTGRKRGGGFENPEPSSPKVTCIGQVRVKTKKKVKQTRSPSKRRSGEISFRKTEQQPTADNNGVDRDKEKIPSQQAQIRYPQASGAHYHHHHPHQQQQQAPECSPHRNQRWVHLPISISCLFPCKSSCFSRDKAEDKQNGPNGNGCGAVFARWLVSVNDGEGGKRREIELVVGGGDEDEAAAEERISMKSSRRHVFEDFEVKDDRIEIKGQSLEDAEEKARVSICIPPKNALLLMRCRSDPMKMASLGNRFSWDAQDACKNGNENVEEKNEVSEGQEEVSGCEGGNEAFEQEDVFVGNNEEQEISDKADQENLELTGVGEPGNVEKNRAGDLLVISSEEMVEENGEDELQQEIVNNEEKLVGKDEDEVESNVSSSEALLDQENAEHYEDGRIEDGEEEVKDSPPICHLSSSPEPDAERNEVPVTTFLEDEALMDRENEETEEESNTIEEKVPIFVDDCSEEKRASSTKVKPDPETIQQEDQEEKEDEKLKCLEMGKSETQELLTSSNIEEPPDKKEKEGQVLPECLLLMMCEPKLSMEVSKETWVCSTDFIRWLPERPRKKVTETKAAEAPCGGCDHEPVKRRLSNNPKPSKPPVRNNDDQQQPPRSSCSLPEATAAASMATVIEQKLVDAVGYEPLVLSRCKSEPMRTAAAKLMPESCFWKSAVRKMEPHRRAALGVGAAGVGF